MEASQEQLIGQKQNDPLVDRLLANEPAYVAMEFRWKNNPRWYKTELTHQEYADTMSKGMIDGKPIVETSLWYADDYVLVYSFEAAGSGNNPWRIEKA